MVLQQLLESQRFSIQGARFRVRNIVGLPPIRWTWDDVSFRASTLLVLTSSILITDLFNLEDKRGGKGRSLADDQLEIFGSIERSLSSVGVEGRPCLLRFICEMHQRPIGRNSILGEVFDVVFSPKPSLVDVLHDYSVASERGAGGGDCAAAYAACPMSLLALMKAGQDQSDYEQAVSGPQDGQRLAVTKVQADQIRIGDLDTTGASSQAEDDPFDDNSPNHLYNTGIPIWQ